MSELHDSREGQIDHRVDVAPLDRRTLRRSLDFDDLAARRRDYVEIDARRRVLDVAEVQQETARIEEPYARRGDGLAKRARADLRERQRERDEAARDRRRSRAAVGLEDVAVDCDCAGAEIVHVNGRTQVAADQPLNLLRAASEGLAPSIPVLALGVGAWMHLVFGGEPALSLALEKLGHLLVDGGRAQDDGPTGAVEHGAFRRAVEARNHLDGSKRVGSTAIGSRHGAGVQSWCRLIAALYLDLPQWIRVTCVTT